MAGPHYNSPGRFPSPYVNDTKEDDPMIKRVPMKTTDIGSRKVSIPSGMEAKSDIMGINHVGGSTGKSK